MDRRAFLSLLGLGTTGAAAVQSLPFTSLLYERGSIPSAAPLTDLSELTRYVEHRVSRQLHAPLPMAARVSGGHLIGDAVRGRTLTDQYNVQLSLWNGRAVSVAADLDFIADQLAEHLNKDDIRVFGNMPRPSGVLDVSVITSDRMSLRGVSQYLSYPDHLILRFDVLGGRM